MKLNENAKQKCQWHAYATQKSQFFTISFFFWFWGLNNRIKITREKNILKYISALLWEIEVKTSWKCLYYILRYE